VRAKTSFGAAASGGGAARGDDAQPHRRDAVFQGAELLARERRWERCPLIELRPSRCVQPFGRRGFAPALLAGLTLPNADPILILAMPVAVVASIFADVDWAGPDKSLLSFFSGHFIPACPTLRRGPHHQRGCWSG
jgi:hypothetical protein